MLKGKKVHAMIPFKYKFKLGNANETGVSELARFSS